MGGIRLLALAEPVAAPGTPAGRPTLGPVSPDPAAPGVAGPDALDRVLASRLDRARPAVRWGIGSGRDASSAAARAALALDRARGGGSEVGFATGDPWRDALLADLGLALAALLEDLTPRQAEIAGLILVDGARQAEVAAALGVSRATVSVAVARGRLGAIAATRRAIEAVLVGAPEARSGAAASGASAASVARKR